MKTLIAMLALFTVALPAFAQKPCEELKSEIAAKLDARGVKKYQLDIVAAADLKARKAVGGCEGGKKRIVYTKG